MSYKLNNKSMFYPVHENEINNFIPIKDIVNKFIELHQNQSKKQTAQVYRFVSNWTNKRNAVRCYKYIYDKYLLYKKDDIKNKLLSVAFPVDKQLFHFVDNFLLSEQISNK